VIVAVLAIALLSTAGVSASARSETSPAAEGTTRFSPADLEGTWAGRATHESDACDFGLRFTREANGRVLARVWLPCLNSYGSAIGWLTASDTGWVVPEAPLILTRAGGGIAGSFYQSSLRFTAQRADSLPREPDPPPVGIGPEPLWTYRAGAPLWAAPVITGNVAYFGDAAGRFHAVRVADGHAIWTFDAGTPLFGAALVTKDAIYFLGDSGELIRLRRICALVWRVSLTDPARSLPSNEAVREFREPDPRSSRQDALSRNGGWCVPRDRRGERQTSVARRTRREIRASAALAGSRVTWVARPLRLCTRSSDRSFVVEVRHRAR
jgi:hypothetical protein